MSDLIRPSELGGAAQDGVADLELRFGPQAVAELEALRGHYPTAKACILPALWIAQREYGGFIGAEAIAEVAYRLRRSRAEVEGVATYYSMYNTAHPVGRHMIEVCTCLSCHVNGAYRLLDSLKAKLGIDVGQTTPDGVFTLHEVECLNACDRAPVVQVGDQYYGPVTDGEIDEMIAQLRNSEGSTVTRLADQIVRVQVGDPSNQTS